MKRKFFAAVLSQAMVLSLEACGGTNSSGTSSDSSDEADTSSEATSWVPDKNITVVVPYGAGGTTDLSTRALLDVAGKSLPSGVNFVVENVAGSGGMVGCEQVATAKADGYTLVAMSCDLPLNRALGVTEMVAEEAFIPLCRTQNEPYAIIVRSDSDIQSLEDMVAVAQSGPEALSIGITGIGTGNGLACLTFQEYFDCALKLVPFDSAADAMVAVVNALGEVFDEASEMAVYSWITVAAPAGTPDEVVNYLFDLLNTACKSTEYADAVEGFYMTPQPLDSIDKMVDYWKSQYEYYVYALGDQAAV